jgi:uncharacterized protein YqeY
MSLRDTLRADLKDAMRSKDELRKTVIRQILTAIKQAETELDASGQRRQVDDSDILALIARQAKQRRESIVEFEKGGRDDLIAQEEAELQMLESYMPTQLTAEQIKAEARAIIADVGASGPRDIGLVMRPLMSRLRGRADGTLVNQIVRELLAG